VLVTDFKLNVVVSVLVTDCNGSGVSVSKWIQV